MKHDKIIILFICWLTFNIFYNIYILFISYFSKYISINSYIVYRYIAFPFQQIILDSIVASISPCHGDDPGSIPGQGALCVVIAQMVECALSMREARGSMPLDYTFFLIFFFYLFVISLYLLYIVKLVIFVQLKYVLKVLNPPQLDCILFYRFVDSTIIIF